MNSFTEGFMQIWGSAIAVLSLKNLGILVGVLLILALWVGFLMTLAVFCEWRKTKKQQRS